MKKRIAILSLIAIFVSVTSLSAQTKPVAKTAKGQTEVKAVSKVAAPASCANKAEKSATCCKGKTAAECKNMTAAEKAKCPKDSPKVGAKVCCVGTAKACDKKVNAAKVATKTTVVAKK